MRELNYEKPSMKFVSLRNEESVANTCWGGKGTDMSWYYDTKGTGYVGFQIAAGECDLNLINVTYYEYKDEPGVPLDSSSDRYAEMYAALKNAGGDAGNSFKGEEFEFPTRPDPEWS